MENLFLNFRYNFIFPTLVQLCLTSLLLDEVSEVAERFTLLNTLWCI